MGSRAWNDLREIASSQEGLFTSEQAAAAGISRQLLRAYVQFGNASRVRRGIYRVAYFPPGDHEYLIELWLWAKQSAVFSHETALSLHGLSDVLPKRVHVTVPAGFRRRATSVPAGLVLHKGTVPEDELGWVGPVPVTEPGRTLLDCASAHFSPDLLAQALDQAHDRGLLSPARLAEINLVLRGAAR